MKKFVIIAVYSFLLTGCSPMMHHQGKLVEPEQLSSIKQGHHTKRDVMHRLGSPTVMSAYGGDVWHYISKRTARKGIFNRQTLDQKVVTVQFNDIGVVKDIQTAHLKDGQEIKPVLRETPTTGQKDSALKQIFGNFGRFSRRDSKFDK